MRILLCTNGTQWANQAFEIGKQIALATASEVEIFIVARKESDTQPITRYIEPALEDMRAKDIDFAITSCTGRMRETVTCEAQSAPYDLVVVGSRGRRGIRRLFLGSLAAQMIEHSPTSVLVVKGQKRKHPLKKFLVCSAAGPASEKAIAYAGDLAQAMGASLTLIHVMSQVALTDEALINDLNAGAQDLIDSRSREGVHLGKMLDLLAVKDIQARAVVRHGLVVDEIIAEAREGKFDLLILGAHVTPGLNSLLVGDLTEQIMLAANLPVLVVRQIVQQD